jgi:hypothetical protein
MKVFPVEILHELFVYDHETGKIFNRISRRGAKRGKEAGEVKRDGYRRILIGGEYYYSHRVAYAMHNGKWPDVFLDHAVGAFAGNAIGNLRPSTHTQNMQNAKLSKANTSGVKGVYWLEENGRPE